MPCWRQSARNGTYGSTRLATLGEPLRVGDEGLHLFLRPVVPDRRHAAEAVAHGGLERLRVAEHRVPAQRRADVALVELVADEADVLELLLAELLRRRALARGEEGVVLAPRHHLDRRRHLRVLDPAQLRAAAGVLAHRRLEPGAVRLAGDC